MKNIFKKARCFIFGHKWVKHWRTKYIDPFDIDDAIEVNYQVTKCARCGKIKENSYDAEI